MFNMTIIYIYSKLRIYINPFVGLLAGCQITPTPVPSIARPALSVGKHSVSPALHFTHGVVNVNNNDNNNNIPRLSPSIKGG